MKLIFEKSVPGRRCSILPRCDVEEVQLPQELRRQEAPALPELSEVDLSRHYTELCQHVHGVNCGFYPLGSCTMKYNPRIDEEMAALPGFAGVHPLAPEHAVAGCREVLDTVHRLNRQRGITVVHITHHMSEAEDADRVIVMNDGVVAMDGTPRDIFSRVEELRSLGLAAPDTVELLHRLNEHGMSLPLTAITVDECARAIFQALHGAEGK